MMKRLLCLLLTIYSVNLFAQNEVRTNIELTQYHELRGELRGQLKGPFEFQSKIIEGTARQYWIYVPEQYDGSQPANVLVFQDGQRSTNLKGSIRGPIVLENLIALKEIPVTIGIFITPGHRSRSYPTNLGFGNPDNRAQEYDAMDDRYARFITEEMLPLVGKDYVLTDDPNRRAIGGTSSGAIAAFTVAWHRPEYFRNVFSGIGSYVSIGFKPNENPIKLGGQDYPALIRREPIHPIRIFIQDGSNDLDNEWGNWFLANQQMVSAMNYANRLADQKGLDGPRYEVKSVWTDGQHNDKHPGALLPEGLKWLWENQE